MRRALLLQDDTVYATFDDGSFLTLQSNAQCFTFISGDTKQTIKQLTPFACFKEFDHQSLQQAFTLKSKLIEVLNFVNGHTCCPYLVESLAPKHLLFKVQQL